MAQDEVNAFDIMSQQIASEFAGVSWNSSASWNTELASYSMMSVGGSSTFQNSVLSDYAPQPIASLQALEYLRHYWLVDSILILFGSILQDAFTKNSLDAVIKDVQTDERNTDLENKVNDYIKKTGFIDLVNSASNQDRMYYGNVCHYIEKGHYYDIESPYIGMTLVKGTEVVKWVTAQDYNTFSPLVSLADTSMDVTTIDRNHFICYQNDPVILKRLTIKYLKEENVFENLTYDPDLPDFVVPYTVQQGVSIFNSVLGKIYQIMIREFLLDILSLKAIMRQDLLSAQISPDAQNVPKVIQALKDVEAGLNTGDLSFSVINPSSLMQRIMYYATNSIKVVPALQSVGIPDLVRRPDEEDKRNRLTQEKQDMLNDIYRYFGVEEFFTGQANKWESIQRNSRLMTLVDKLIKNETKMVGDLLQYFIDEWTEKKGKYKLTFEFDTSNVIANFTQQNLLKNLQEKMDSMSQALQTGFGMAQNEQVDAQKVTDYLREQFKALDSAAAEFIKDPETQSNEDSDDDRYR